jgi:hypothetical protein
VPSSPHRSKGRHSPSASVQKHTRAPRISLGPKAHVRAADQAPVSGALVCSLDRAGICQRASRDASTALSAATGLRGSLGSTASLLALLSARPPPPAASRGPPASALRARARTPAGPCSTASRAATTAASASSPAASASRGARAAALPAVSRVHPPFSRKGDAYILCYVGTGGGCAIVPARVYGRSLKPRKQEAFIGTCNSEQSAGAQGPERRARWQRPTRLRASGAWAPTQHRPRASPAAPEDAFRAR